MSELNPSYNRKLLEGNHLFPKLGPWYFATSMQRMEPSFFIIGIQKGGTTSLTKYLTDHPQIITPQRKDIYFFNNQENYFKGLSWYKAHFAHRFYKRVYEKRKSVTGTITFDPTPNYFSAPFASERLHKNYPGAKLILLLRNPVERAWSNYRMSKYLGFEKLSFEDALLCETERIESENKRLQTEGGHNFVLQRLGYRTNGIYADYLKEWLKFFSSKQLLILKSEDLFENPSDSYRQVTDFVGLNPFDDVTFENFNKGKIESEINPETRKELLAFYEPHNRELFQLIGRELNWH